ncbi:MAG: carboxypeptidase regulatory-like domain-containing protein [Methylococcales bacterium]|jgi:hypothetical protein|nr:carboxypeptidase regulatory-like domain-containing protein [Methylococcales bacterium]MBT7408428.1 carboxypeptidase regulatory-like domain-containing protein [Methylococcales bacterium]
MFKQFCAFGIIILFSSLSNADDKSSIRGILKDINGSYIAGLQITLTNMNTLVKQQTNSDGLGNYSFEKLDVGKYKMTIPLIMGANKSFQHDFNIRKKHQAKYNIKLDYENPYAGY